jgi:hypothetical protein
MDLHKKNGDVLNRDVLITTLLIKNLQAQNEKIRTQLKDEKFGNRTKKIRIEELEEWVMDMGANPQYVTSVQALVNKKDTNIQALNKRLNIHGIEHAQTPELQVIQAKKDELLQKLVQMGENIKVYEKHIEILN